MITKFRIEAEGPNKDDVINELNVTGRQVQQLVTPGTANGNWECTDDAVTQHHVGYQGSRRMVGYKGRMNFTFKVERG